MRDVSHEELDWVIGVNSAERVLRKTYRQRGALKRAWGRRVLRQRPAPPDVAGALAERDKHAHGGYGVEHGKCVSLRLIERVYFVFCTRRDGKTGLGGGRRKVVFVLRDGIVERSPYEHLQFRKVLFDNAQYTLIFTRGLHAVYDERMSVRIEWEKRTHAHNRCSRTTRDTSNSARDPRTCAGSATSRGTPPWPSGA
jgi:hypothetical protein